MLLKAKMALALVLSFLMFVPYTFALSNDNDEKQEAVTQFRYTGASISNADLTDPSNWEVATENEQCSPGETLPCIVAPNMSSITTPADLANHLSDFGDEQLAQAFVEEYTLQKRD